MVDDALDERGLSRRIAYYTSSFLLALPIVLKTDCVLTAPATLINVGVDGLHVMEPPLEMPVVKVYGGWHPNWTVDAKHKWVRNLLFEGMSCEDHNSSLMP